MKTERLTPAQIQTLTPLLEERQTRLRQILTDLGDGQREWDVDVDLAINDVHAVLNTMVPLVPEDDD
ncbi:hypothetical protein [Marinobacter subterrani]|uniref:Uncharacterized protein n=1 Tax=Marinobacter subterrani TaxID=1658765 RepID=A0A0J7LYP9_9GAMM|nr:hypothetical protein [Marinobacter subterrani]KMQ74020.1 hypothetical protein Msub_10191 [Marinobacter subterrani]